MSKEQNKVMSAEEWYDSETEQGYVFMDMFDFATQYSDQILSQRIDELSEMKYSKNQIKELRQLFQNRFDCYADSDTVVMAMTEDKFIETILEFNSILKIANDFKTELNLQTNQNQSGN